jgi:adenylate cyclase
VFDDLLKKNSFRVNSSGMPQSRQLAAIMFTDIVGYTALMGNDEQHAFTLLNKNRQLQKPIIAEFDGRWIKELGDGTMASFNTVSDAVNAAIKIQEACKEANDFQLRIGIHQGEVVFENDDVFGDAVNIAARIQAAANPGCIFISETVNHNISNKKEIKTQYVKEAALKNVSLPVKMYQVLTSGSEAIASNPSEKVSLPNAGNRNVYPAKRTWKLFSITAIVIALALAAYFLYHRKPAYVPVETERSIAVLPFVNMSNDTEQEYFSDGISEEIINVLAQVPALKVIGRTSSFAFKGKNQDLKVIGEQLKVSYILEGSVRRSGNKLRVTAQLINAADGYHLYSETFDRELENIFAIQDDISLAILNAIKIKLFGLEKKTVLKKYTDNVEAYQLYLQGRFHMNKFTPDGFLKAIEYFDAAIVIDSMYAIAFADKAFCYMNLFSWNWAPPDKCLPQAIQAANKSLELDDEIAESHLNVGRIKLHFEWKVREAQIEFKKALAINPNNAEVHVQLGFCAALLGNNKEAIEHASIADRLDPFSLLNLTYIGIIYWAVGDPDKQLAIGKRLVDMAPNFPSGHLRVGSSNWLFKKYEEAITEMELAVKLNPDLNNLSALGSTYGLMGKKMKAREVIEKMKKIEGADIVGNTYTGGVYGAIDEWDTAFQYYDKAIENRENRILWVKFDLKYLQIDMKDPRVLRLFEKMGQPYE